MQDGERGEKYRRRLGALMAAESRAFELLKHIEQLHLIAPGRSEREIEKEIYNLAEDKFGVRRHWHKRIVRAGVNTVRIATENPPVQIINEEDIVFVDLGPVFDEWEADVGKTYVIGGCQELEKLCSDLERQFYSVREEFLRKKDITGADLFEISVTLARDAGWKFGGNIAGHVVGEFPHARLPGPKNYNLISPLNDAPLRNRDKLGNDRFWILEVHLVEESGKFGGFYERLMLDR